jgi:hypothetical protein
MVDEKKNNSDADLAEFRELIIQNCEKAKRFRSIKVLI